MSTDADPSERSKAEDEPEDDSALTQRGDQQALWVDLQIRKAMERGDFDNLPGSGKPIRGLGETHDPDWWVKSFVEREKITGVLPPALGLRNTDAELDANLDQEATEMGVRRAVEEFNRTIVEARRQLLGGPPVITRTRDVEQEVAAWLVRRAERRSGQGEQLSSPGAGPERRARWWRRRKR